LTLGNLPATRRNRPGSFAVLLLALLPVPPKLTKFSADYLQRQINADTLRGVFELLFEPLQNVALEGVNIDCADGKVRRCFPILSAWIADHMENVALHGIKSNVCPKCKVLPGELGTDANSHEARDYARYECCEGESASDDSYTMFETLGIDLEKNVFHGLHRVSAPGLHKPDLLHTVYLELFKHLWTGSRAFSRNTPGSRLLTTPGRRYRHTRAFLCPKRPIARSRSGKEKR